MKGQYLLLLVGDMTVIVCFYLVSKPSASSIGLSARFAWLMATLLLGSLATAFISVGIFNLYSPRSKRVKYPYGKKRKYN
jgi:hypothetical protein